MQIQNYFRGYVSSVIARDQAKFEKSPAVKKAAKMEAKAALSDDVVAQIKEHAKKDAQVNVYMQKDYIQMINAHKQQRVSPDRQDAIFRANMAMNSAARGKGSSDLLLLLISPIRWGTASILWPGILRIFFACFWPARAWRLRNRPICGTETNLKPSCGRTARPRRSGKPLWKVCGMAWGSRPWRTLTGISGRYRRPLTTRKYPSGRNTMIVWPRPRKDQSIQSGVCTLAVASAVGIEGATSRGGKFL